MTGSANTLLSGSENNEKERGEGTCVADDQTTIAEAKIRCEHCVKFRRKSHQSKRALLGTPPPPGSPVHRRRSHRRSSNDTGATRRESSEASIRLNEKQEIINIMNDFTSAAAAADIPLKIEGLGMLCFIIP